MSVAFSTSTHMKDIAIAFQNVDAGRAGSLGPSTTARSRSPANPGRTPVTPSWSGRREVGLRRRLCIGEGRSELTAGRYSQFSKDLAEVVLHGRGRDEQSAGD